MAFLVAFAMGNIYRTCTNFHHHKVASAEDIDGCWLTYVRTEGEQCITRPSVGMAAF